MPAPQEPEASPVAAAAFTNFGLVITDAFLYHPRPSHAAKLVHAATCAYPNRDPSLSQLEAALPLSRRAIPKAKNELKSLGIAGYHEARGAWQPVGDGEGTRMYRLADRLTWTATEAEPRHPSNQGRTIKLPGAILERLPRGTKNASLFPLLALHYIGAQLRQGAIQVEDHVAAWLLGLSEGQAKRMKQALLDTGLLELVRRERPSAVYAMPEATAHPPAPETLEVEKTRRLLTVEIADEPAITIYGSERQHAEAARVARSLEPWQRDVAVLRLLSARTTADDAFERRMSPADALRDELTAESRPLDEEAIAKKAERARWPKPEGAYEAAALIATLAEVASEEWQIIGFDKLTAQSGTTHNRAVCDRFGTRHSPVRDTPFLPTTFEKPENLTAFGRDEEGPSDPWPPGLRERAVAVFGKKAITAGTKTHGVLTAQLFHAVRVWREKYAFGEPLSDEQAEVAADVLGAALEKIGRLDARGRYAALASKRSPILTAVNDDPTHDAFAMAKPPKPIARQGEDLIDASAEIAAALAELSTAQHATT